LSLEFFMHHKKLPVVLILSLLPTAAPLLPTTLDSAELKVRWIAPIRRPPGFEEQRKAAEAAREAVESGRLTPVAEEEATVKPTARKPVVTTAFVGMDAAVNAPSVSVPPDTIAATGPNHIVEVVNSAIAIYDRATGTVAGGFPQLLSDFFTVNISECIFDPVVAYDELLGRFYIGALDVPELCGELPATTARLLYAVSNSSDPTAGFTSQYAIDVDETRCQRPSRVVSALPLQDASSIIAALRSRKGAIRNARKRSVLDISGGHPIVK
jgi:hypothetical protein